MAIASISADLADNVAALAAALLALGLILWAVLIEKPWQRPREKQQPNVTVVPRVYDWKEQGE